MPTEAVPMASIRSKLNLASLLWGQLQLILLFNQDIDFIQFVCDSVSFCPFAFENLFLKELDYYNENWLWICPGQYLILGSIYFQTGYNLQVTLWKEQSGFHGRNQNSVGNPKCNICVCEYMGYIWEYIHAARWRERKPKNN